MSVRAILDELDGLPARIRDQQLDLMEAGRQAAVIRRDLAARRAEVAQEVANAQDGHGKPLYPNDILRRAEAFRREDLDAKIQNLREVLRLAEYRAERARIEFAFLRNRLGALKAMARLAGAEVAPWTRVLQ